jgi:putative transposase
VRFSRRRSSTVDSSELCYIHAYRHRFGVEPICAVLAEHDMKIAPQTYYRWLACPVRPADLEEAYLVNAIVDLYRRNKCVYGALRIEPGTCGLGADTPTLSR